MCSCIITLTLIPLYIHIPSIMQHDNSSNQSDAVSRCPATSVTENTPNVHMGFTTTHQDAGILKEYLDDFQKANTGDRADIIQKAMAEIYEERPHNSKFDKMEAGKACCI